MKKVMGRSVVALVMILAAGTWGESQGAGFDLTSKVKKGAPSKVGQTLGALQQDYATYRQAGGVRTLGLFKPANPLLRVRDGYVAVNATATGDPAALRAELEALGMTSAATAGAVVSGWLPLGALESLPAVESLRFVRPAYAVLHSGLAMTQGDAAMRADEVRASLGVNGAGTTVGVLSDSYNCLGQAATDVAAGDLPAGVAVLDDTGCGSGLPVSDEGRALLQIVHDVAPGAALAFHTALPGQANYVQGIQDLANAGADVILDDLLYLDEPMFQDGLVARAVDTVVSQQGVAYFSAAGNAGHTSYESVYRDMNIEGELFHDFDPGAGADEFQNITIPEGGTIILVLQWNEPFGSVTPFGSRNDLDIYLADATMTTALAWSIEENIFADPIEAFIYTNPVGSGTTTFNLLINHWDGPAPGRVKYVLFNFTGSINEYATNSSTLFGHANAAGAEAVGAAFYLETPEYGTAPPLLEPYSALGGTGIYFDTAGNSLITPVVRQKPELVAPDGVNTTWNYPGSVDVESDGLPNIFGTSAAVAHAGAAAALLRDINPHLTSAAIYQALEGSAVDMDNPLTGGFDAGFDYASGYGLIRLDAAVASASVQQQIGVFRAGKWYLDGDGSGAWNPGADILCTSFGLAGDLPVAGDWGGDGRQEIGAFRAGRWYLDSNGSGAWNPGIDTVYASFGLAGDLPVAGDWNGDGRDEIGVFRAGKWYLDGNGNGVWNAGVDTVYASFGLAGDRPMAGDWDGDGRDEIGVFRAGKWYLDGNGNGGWNPGVDVIYAAFGLTGDLPVTGRWK